MSSPHCSHKANIFSNIIILDPSTTFQTYDLISCDTSCDCIHVPLHCSRELKEIKTENKRKRIFKSRKIDRKEKKNVSVQVHHNIYKIDYFVLRTLSNSLTLTQYKVLFSSNILSLNHNMEVG